MSLLMDVQPLAAADSLGLRLNAFAAEQLQQAEAHLARQGEERHAGIHQARKCIRRTRAALALGAKVFDHRAQPLDDALGRICRGLSPLRDAQALIDALKRLEDDASASVRAILPGAVALARDRRDQALQRALARDPDFISRRRRLRDMRQRLMRLNWQAIGEDDVRAAVARSQRRLDKAHKRAHKHPERDDAWHVYRRRLRRLRQQDSLLAEVQPDLRPVTEGLAEQARILGESQDDALVLRHCRTRSPFPRDQRALLRSTARERLRRVRRT